MFEYADSLAIASYVASSIYYIACSTSFAIIVAIALQYYSTVYDFVWQPKPLAAHHTALH